MSHIIKAGLLTLTLWSGAQADNSIVLSLGLKNVVENVSIKDKKNGIDLKKSINDTALNLSVGYRWDLDSFYVEAGAQYYQIKPLVYLNDKHHFSYKRSPIFNMYGVWAIKFKDVHLYTSTQMLFMNKTLKINTKNNTERHKRSNQINITQSVGIAKELTPQVSIFAEWCPCMILKDKVTFESGTTYKINKKEDQSYILVGVGYKL